MRAGHNNTVWNKIIRDELWTEQGCRCFYCTRAMKRHEATLDHKIPQKEHGRNDRTNFVASCQPCNIAKGHMPISEFKKLITGISPACYAIELIRAIRRINKFADRAVLRIEGCV